jgi:hypothetical protein
MPQRFPRIVTPLLLASVQVKLSVGGVESNCRWRTRTRAAVGLATFPGQIDGSSAELRRLRSWQQGLLSKVLPLALKGSVKPGDAQDD